MAITFVEMALFANLRQANLLPRRPAVLEIGENNYYCDVPLDRLVGCIHQYATDPEVKDRLLAEFTGLQRSAGAGPPPPAEVTRILYSLARIAMRAMLDYSTLSSVDLSAGPNVEYPFDLNNPLPIDRQFDIVLNLGTAEHIFNIAQCYRTMHERTRPGGLIITCGPFTGGVDHGFYSVQPTFYYDLAAANGYQVMAVMLTTSTPQSIVQIHHREEFLTLAKDGRLPSNAGIYGVFRKGVPETPFAVPTQGYYAQTLSPAASDMWLNMR